MNPRRRQILNYIATAVAVIVLGVVVSALHARKICDQTLSYEVAPPPHYSTEFILHPERSIAGADRLGFCPGWVITYAPRSRRYGTALFVNFFGKIEARGVPKIVTDEQAERHQQLEAFGRQFAKIDASIKIGMTLPSIKASIPQPYYYSTNSGNHGILWVNFFYEPAPPGSIKYDSLTNGFELEISNGVVVQKLHTFSSVQ